MAGSSLKTEAIVLRSIRYGEADRILHLYTPGPRAGGGDRQGRAAGAEPVRRSARAVLADRACVLHQGRGELYTVTAVDTVDARPGLRDSAAALDAAARACDAVARLFETDDPHPEVFALLANELTLLACGPAATEPALCGPRMRSRSG